jgi:hypothetical protein
MVPGPFVITARVYEGEVGVGVGVGVAEVSKVAVTVTDPFPVSVHAAVPLQPPPDQPRNVEPDEGVVATVTTVPAR